MSWRTTPFAVGARRIARKLGIASPLARFLNGGGYETQYDQKFASALRSGDVVYDVGANVGHYTCLFSERVGPEGRVVAFEPSHINFSRLNEATRSLENVSLLNFGLGRCDSRAHFCQGSDDLGATSRVAVASASSTVIEIRSVASLLAENVVTVPNAVKIDVEGQEYEVLMGFGGLLDDCVLRAIGIEMHFEILQNQGQSHVPAAIESMLKTHGFSVHWPDVSHILAMRD